MASSSTKKPATKKPATKKPATKKPATKKPATKKPEPKGKPYERLVAAVRKKLGPTLSVKWDDKIRANSRAIRQFDVEIRGPEKSDFALAVVEVKDRINKVTINMVGDFYTALTGVNATKGIMVSRRGFTEDALLEAKERKIDTCILRPANDDDWKGYLRGIDMHVQSIVLRYDDAEMVLVNGATVAVPRPHSCILVFAGQNDFFDRIASNWLSNHEWIEGEPVALRLGPGVTVGEEEPIEVTLLKFRPTYQDGLMQEASLTRPEDWVFMKCLPGGKIDVEEKHFFEFRELDELAAEFKMTRQAKQVPKVKKSRRPSVSRP